MLLTGQGNVACKAQQADLNILADLDIAAAEHPAQAQDSVGGLFSSATVC